MAKSKRAGTPGSTVSELSSLLKSNAALGGSVGTLARMTGQIKADQLAAFTDARAVIGSIELPRLTVPGIADAVEAMRANPLTSVDTTSMLGGVTQELLQQWRKAAFGGLGTSLAAADSMARVIGESNLGLLAAESLVPLPRVDRALRDLISEAAADYTLGIGASVKQLIHDTVFPAAFLATRTLQASVKARVEEGERAHQSLTAMDWWFPPHAPLRLLFEVGRIAEEGKRVPLRQAMVSMGNSRWFGGMVNDWMDVDVVRDRRRFIMDGFRQHKAGNYRVAIPVLLPHLEGIAVDAFEPTRRETKLKDAVATASTMATISGPALVEALTVLWAFHTFSGVAAGTRKLNRHYVLHGRSTGFGTAENSIKVLFAFDILVAVIREARRRP